MNSTSFQCIVLSSNTAFSIPTKLAFVGISPCQMTGCSVLTVGGPARTPGQEGASLGLELFSACSCACVAAPEPPPTARVASPVPGSCNTYSFAACAASRVPGSCNSGPFLDSSAYMASCSFSTSRETRPYSL